MKEFCRLPHVQEIQYQLACIDAFEANIPSNPNRQMHHSLYLTVDIDRARWERELKQAFKNFMRERPLNIM